MSKKVYLTEEQLCRLVAKVTKMMLNETDRHRPGYWKERWKKEKESGNNTDRHEYWKERWKKEKLDKKDSNVVPKQRKKTKKDRHRKGYYHDYNASHPERLERGYTKGYENGKLSDGPKKRNPNYPDGCVMVLDDGYYIDRMGWLRNIDPITDALTIKNQEWHDDDWCEGSFDD